jgi:beta-lactamase class A
MSTKTLAAHGHHVSGLSGFGLWLHRHQRVFDVIGIAIVSLCGLSVGLQLLYPADYALPMMRIGGLEVGGKQATAIIGQLNEYAQKGEVTIASPSKQWRATWQEIGLAVDAEASTDAVLSYAWWERLIPFSSAVRIQQSHTQPLVALVDNEQLDAFAGQLVAEDKQAAKDAMIRVQDGAVVVDEAKHGYVFKVDDVKQQVQALALTEGTTLRLLPETVPYARPTTALNSLKTEAEAMLGRNLTLKLGDKQFKPTAAAVGKWLAFGEDPKTKALQLALNQQAVKEYLATIDKSEKLAPGTSTVTLLDGIEIARTPATAGKTTASDASLANIEAALKGGEAAPVVDLTPVDVGPAITYVRTYSQTDAGLRAVVDAWRADNPGNNAIIVRELTNKKRYAEIEPDKVFVPASTFKIWVFYAIAQKITAGEIGYGTRTDMGWTVEACLEEMIVRSTNPCAISFMNMIGWQETEDMVHAAGFPNTYMNNHGGGDKTTTTRDETNFMLRLYHGTLMAEEPTQRLLGYMKRQIWRTGVPSGVPDGVVVANKVGRYNGWVHDIAIVYGQKSDYILGVMSRGQSWRLFADLSRRVNDFFAN